MTVRGCDGAYGNDKLLAHAGHTRAEDAKTLFSTLVCQSFGHALVEISISNVVGKDMQTPMYCFTSLLRMSGTFARMLVVVKRCILERLYVRPGPAPQAVATTSLELKRFFLANHRSYIKATAWSREPKKPEATKADRAAEAYAAKWDRFWSVWNGKVVGGGARYVPYCGGARCCPEGSEQTATRMAKTLVSLWLSSLPVVPEAGKSTLLAPCVDWFWLGFCLNEIIRHVCERALSAFDAPLSADAKHGEHLSWHELRGVRVQRSLTFLSGRFVAARLTIFALVLEPVRFLTAWALAKSKDFPDPCAHPALLDVVSEQHSPATVALQNLASFVDGSSSRLKLLLAVLGVDSFDTLNETLPEWASLLRVVAFTAIAWVRRRWVTKFAASPYRLAALADVRVDANTKLEMARSFGKLGECCIYRFGRGLRRFCEQGQPLVSEPCVDALRLWSRAASQCFSIADLGPGHKRSKSFATAPPMHWSAFVAAHVNSDTKRLDGIDDDVCRAFANAVGTPSLHAGETGAREKRPKALSAKELFRHDLIEQEKASGRRLAPRWAFWSEWHEFVRTQLAAATPETKQQYARTGLLATETWLA